MALPISTRGRLYAKTESSYGDAAVTFSATDALRHITSQFRFDPFNRVSTPEKKASAGNFARFDRRITAELSTLEAVVRPSGTLNTLPEGDDVYKNALGAVTNVTLNTTVSSGGTTTGATLASAGSLAVGDAVVITRNSVKYIRILQTVAGAAVTWAPALPTSVVNGEAVKGCITYKLTSDLTGTLAFFHLVDTFKRLLIGTAADRLSLNFDANEEGRFTLSGPAQRQLTTGLPSDPVTFTAVGGNAPSGLVGELVIGGTAYLDKLVRFEIDNKFKVRNEEQGNNGLATGAYRVGTREVSVAIEAFAETQATLYDLAVAGTNVSVLKQTGRTEGNICAVFCPSVEFKVPETSDGDDEATWSFQGTALESTLNAGNEITLAFG